MATQVKARLAVQVVLACALVGVVPRARAEAPGSEPALRRAKVSSLALELPAVELVRDDGQTVPLAGELNDGRPVVLNFVFTTCGTVCPVMSQVFSQLQEKLGDLRDRVHMVSITIDPEYDTPERLTAYARKFHAGPQWRFYSSTVEGSVATQRAFEAFRGDKMGHTPVAFLRVGTGKKWVRIDGFATSDELAHELRVLLAAR